MLTPFSAREARVSYGDPKLLKKIAPHLSRVLVLDPFPAAARLLCDLLKGLGASEILTAPSDAAARQALDAGFGPRFVFAEYAGPAVDGPDFVRRLRRSDLTCRNVPVVMASAEATAASIKAARDSGVHEFLVKPFTMGHLARRIEAAALGEREWIEAKMYVGPDRRRFNSGEYGGPRKRQADAEGAARLTAEVIARAMRLMKDALDGFDAKPHAALRAMLQQSAELQQVAAESVDDDLKTAVGSLQRYLLGALESGKLSAALVNDHAGALQTLASGEGGAAETRRLLVAGLTERASRAA